MGNIHDIALKNITKNNGDNINAALSDEILLACDLLTNDFANKKYETLDHGNRENDSNHLDSTQNEEENDNDDDKFKDNNELFNTLVQTELNLEQKEHIPTILN